MANAEITFEKNSDRKAKASCFGYLGKLSDERIPLAQLETVQQ